MLYRIIFGKDFHLVGIPHNSHSATIRIRKGGKIVLGRKSHFSDNNYLWVAEGAEFHLGDYSGFGVNCIISCRDKIVIGNNVMTGPFVTIYDNDHIYKTKSVMMFDGYNTAPIIIGNNVWIGSHVRILKGVTIGDGSVIAAGCTVNKNVPPNSILYQQKTDVIKTKL